MPIYGLTDRGLSFPQIGTIRKGAPKPEGKNAPGADLKYLRVVFDASEGDAEAKFIEVYGKEPTSIRIRLPFDNLDQLASFWLEAYTAGRMIARADGRVYHFKTDHKSGETLVKGGVNVKTGQPWVYEPTVSEYSWTTKEGKRYDVFCKAQSRIRVVVPDLRRAAYLLVTSTSTYDAANLSEQLAAMDELSGHHISQIPLLLKRKPRMISCPNADGTRARREKWLLSIEADPSWIEARLEASERAGYITMGAQPPMELNAPAVDGDYEESEEPVESEGDDGIPHTRGDEP
jgi:hypothetical protein